MPQVSTNTGVTHYEIQKTRRAKVVEDWRKHRETIIHSSEVSFEYSDVRRMRRGVAMGADGFRPTKVLDATVHEIDGGVTSSVHRHSWDAIMFVLEGSGWTEIDGERVHWKPWDTIHLPSWSWHRHGNPGGGKASFTTWSVEPMHEALGMALQDEGGDAPFNELPGRPGVGGSAFADSSSYGRRSERLGRLSDASDSRLITRWEDVNPKVTKRGARSMFLVDESIGFRTSGLTAVMHELAPGLWQSRHRHGGEAWLYVVSGHGHSDIDEVSYEWGPGDLVVVDHWAWHQHFNDDPDRTARLIRVHNFDSLYDTMRVLLDPMDLWSEPEKLDAPEVANVEWPDVNEGRPA